MTKKKNNNVVIDLATVKATLKAFNVEIKTQRKIIDNEYTALTKKEDALYKLEDQARDLENILNLASTIKQVSI